MKKAGNNEKFRLSKTCHQSYPQNAGTCFLLMRVPYDAEAE